MILFANKQNLWISELFKSVSLSRIKYDTEEEPLIRIFVHQGTFL